MRATLILLSLLAAPAMAADAPQLSWGKPGVSLPDYRADANLCASRAWNADVSDTEAAEVFREGTRQIDQITQTAGGTATVDDGAPGGTPDPITMNRQTQIARIVEAARPKERIAEVRNLQQDVMGACLRSLGYIRFALTDRQRKSLSKLKRGSDARHAFLHTLAADPVVLADQRVAR